MGVGVSTWLGFCVCVALSPILDHRLNELGSISFKSPFVCLVLCVLLPSLRLIHLTRLLWENAEGEGRLACPSGVLGGARKTAAALGLSPPRPASMGGLGTSTSRTAAGPTESPSSSLGLPRWPHAPLLGGFPLLYMTPL